MLPPGTDLLSATHTDIFIEIHSSKEKQTETLIDETLLATHSSLLQNNHYTQPT